MKKRYFIFIFYVLTFHVKGQEAISLIEKHFIKENKILFRIAPTNKKVFELIKANSLKITRYSIVNDKLSNETVINHMLHPYWIADTLNWMRLMRKNKDNTAFIYNAIFQNKADSKLNPQQKEKQEKMIYDLMLLSCDFDAEIAKACGLFFKDTTITKSNNYTYKIAVYTNSTSLVTKELISFTVNPTMLSSNLKINELSCKSKNNVCTLKWKAIKYKSNYSGYNIERSEDSLNFIKINTSPVILFSSQFEKNKENIFYSDTMPETNKKYFYKIKGINFFGEESESSNIVTSYSSPTLNSIPLIDSITVIENQNVKLHWRMENIDETMLPKKYILMRCEKDNGIYKVLYSSSSTLSFTDLKPSTSNFYKVGAITFNYDTIYSYSRMATIIDTIPPIVPIGLEATVDVKGNVIIAWKKNKDSDLQGYKLFKANALNEEFVQVNNKFIKDTAFIDKLNLKTLSKNIFYSLAASDNNFNTSERCIAIKVKRPDTIPPSAPILKSAFPGNTGVKLDFILSKSEDIFKHIIFRKNEGDDDFIIVKTLSTKDSSEIYADTTSELGKTYTYKLCAYDEDNNIASSKILNIKYETGYRKKLTTISFSVDRKLKNINLNWDYKENDIEKFVLYRKKENEQLTIIKTVDGKTLSYIDKTPSIGNIYEYRIKAVLYNGAESIISDPIKVEY